MSSRRHKNDRRSGDVLTYAAPATTKKGTVGIVGTNGSVTYMSRYAPPTLVRSASTAASMWGRIVDP